MTYLQIGKGFARLIAVDSSWSVTIDYEGVVCWHGDKVFATEAVRDLKRLFPTWNPQSDPL